MLFTRDAWAGLADGTITLTFRTWTRPQARTGGRYRVGGMLLEATSVAQVRAGDVTDAEARRAGAESSAALFERLGVDDPDRAVWRVELRYVGPDDRIEWRADDALDDAAMTELQDRLDRLDRRAGTPWTLDTLQLIGRQPGVVSTELAGLLGRDRAAFKADVRKLKELGLTESLDVGYRLSPRGEVVTRRRAARGR